MNRCDKCGVGLGRNVTFCPLCGSYVNRGETAAEPCEFNKIPVDLKSRIRVVSILSRLLFIAFCVCCVVAAFNLARAFYLHGRFDFYGWWFIYGAASMIAVKLGVIDMLKKQRYNWRNIVFDCFVGLAYVVFIDWYATGLTSFSFTWVLPGAVFAGCIVLTVFSFNNRLNPLYCMQAFLIAIGFNVLLTVFNVLMSVFSVLPVLYLPSVVSGLAAFAMFAVLMLVKYPDYRKLFIGGVKND